MKVAGRPVLAIPSAGPVGGRPRSESLYDTRAFVPPSPQPGTYEWIKGHARLICHWSEAATPGTWWPVSPTVFTAFTPFAMPAFKKRRVA